MAGILMSEAGVVEHVERDADEDWKRYGSHLKEYASEFIGSLFLVFCVVAAVALLLGAPTVFTRLLPSQALRLFLLGLILGGASWLVALSPPGRLSGAHLNPAVSLGFWLLGKMQVRDLGGYVAGQFVGAAAGAFLGVWALGPLAHASHDAVLRPGSGVGSGAAFLGEIAATLSLCYLVFTFVSSKKLAAWTPAASTLMVAVLVAVDANFSGAGMNPGRWFGPAVVLPLWHLWWVYLVGPLLGALLAVLLRKTGLLFSAMPHTGKLKHDSRYRSIFRHDTLSSASPFHD
jgi:aquaporin Z